MFKFVFVFLSLIIFCACNNKNFKMPDGRTDAAKYKEEHGSILDDLFSKESKDKILDNSLKSAVIINLSPYGIENDNFSDNLITSKWNYNLIKDKEIKISVFNFSGDINKMKINIFEKQKDGIIKKIKTNLENEIRENIKKTYLDLHK